MGSNFATLSCCDASMLAPAKPLAELFLEASWTSRSAMWMSYLFVWHTEIHTHAHSAIKIIITTTQHAATFVIERVWHRALSSHHHHHNSINTTSRCGTGNYKQQ
jgi:hypothetical protein